MEHHRRLTGSGVCRACHVYVAVSLNTSTRKMASPILTRSDTHILLTAAAAAAVELSLSSSFRVQCGAVSETWNDDYDMWRAC